MVIMEEVLKKVEVGVTPAGVLRPGVTIDSLTFNFVEEAELPPPGGYDPI